MPFYRGNVSASGIVTDDETGAVYSVTISGTTRAYVSFSDDKTTYTAEDTSTVTARFTLIDDPFDTGATSFTASGSDSEIFGGSTSDVIGAIFDEDVATATFSGAFNSSLTQITGGLSVEVFGFSGSISGSNITLTRELVPVVSFTSGPAYIRENQDFAVYTLTRSFVPVDDRGATVRVYNFDGAAVDGVNYSAIDELVEFLPGSRTATVTVPIFHNPAIQPNLNIRLRVEAIDDDVTIGFGVADTIIVDVDGTIVGGVVTGTSGDDVIEGGSNNDTLAGKGGADDLNGGDGNDIATYVTSTSGVDVNLSTGSGAGGEAEGDTLSNIEGIIGSNFGDTLTGNEQDNFFDGGNGNDIITGGGGNDTASYGRSLGPVYVDLGTGTASGSGGNDTLVEIENLIGTNYNDVLIGNAADNVIEGLGGADTLIGSDGTDTVSYANSTAAVTVNLVTGIASGGAGLDKLSGFENIIGSKFNDTFIVGAGTHVLDGRVGTDTVSYAGLRSAVDVDLIAGTVYGFANDTLVSIENVIGTSGTDTLRGNELNNRLDGGARNDLLEGGAGNDVLLGGTGIDTVSYVNATASPGGIGVTVNINLTTAQNTVRDGIDTLSGFENILGSLFNDTLTGNALENFIDGSDGNDFIQGGVGADELHGGAGNDTVSYLSSKAGVTIDISTPDFQASAGDADGDLLFDFENIVGSNFADALMGDSQANRIEGLVGNDILVGNGGVDTLIGGLGNDTYVVTNSDVTVIELAGQGTDTIKTDVITYELGLNFENLVIFGAGVNGIGNDVANSIAGNMDNNLIDGRKGADTMTGGDGSDTYYVDNVGDKVIELANQGNDEVFSTISYTLAANVEALTLLDGPLPNINGTGNALDNTITGNSANNILAGGLGSDMLQGGSGNDAFIFNTKLDPLTNVDWIADFDPGADKIRLENAIFTKLVTVGTLASSMFDIDTADFSTRILYNSSSGELFYDTDGAGSADAIHFATLGAGLSLASTDFLVI